MAYHHVNVLLTSLLDFLAKKFLNDHIFAFVLGTLFLFSQQVRLPLAVFSLLVKNSKQADAVSVAYLVRSVFFVRLQIKYLDFSSLVFLLLNLDSLFHRSFSPFPKMLFLR